GARGRALDHRIDIADHREPRDRGLGEAGLERRGREHLALPLDRDRIDGLVQRQGLDPHPIRIGAQRGMKERVGQIERAGNVRVHHALERSTDRTARSLSAVMTPGTLARALFQTVAPGTALARRGAVATHELPEPRTTGPIAAPNGTRILVVDDNARVRRSTAAALSRIGFHVMTAEDGAPAVAIAENTPPDLALVDFEMPTPGLVVVRRLKELYGPAVWVAVLSGEDGDEMRTACFDAGADDVLLKPAMIPELHRRMLAAARTQRAFVDARVARERTDRLLAYGAEAAAMLANDLNNGLAVALCNMDFLEETTKGLDLDQTQALTSTRNALRRMSGL